MSGGHLCYINLLQKYFDGVKTVLHVTPCNFCLTIYACNNSVNNCIFHLAFLDRLLKRLKNDFLKVR